MRDPNHILVEFCERNVNRATRALLIELTDRPDVTIRARGCMCRCTQCFDTPYLRIDGRDIEGPTHRSIIEEYLGAAPCVSSVRPPIAEP